jgi:hypothetical protein
MNRDILEINYFHIELGHTWEEYKERFGTLYEEGDLWDYSLEDVKTNAVEGNCNLVYWGIVVDDKLRVYETTIQEEFELNYRVLQDYIWHIYRLDEQNCVVEVYNEQMGKNLPNTRKSVIDIIIQDKEFLKLVYQEEYPYVYKWLAEKDCYETRTIKFFDDYEDLFITTNAPSFLIQEAIKYRDMVLTYDLPICSDFECIRDYIKEKGFNFGEIKVSDESYYW